MRVVGYCRVSSVNQVDNFSIPAQKAAIRDYCERNNFELIHFYEDRGISGATMSRPALSKLLNDLENNIYDKVVVWSISRLSRNNADILQIVQRFETAGKAFHSISDNLGDNSASGKLLMNIFGALGEYERGMLIENVKSGLNQRARDGLHTGAPVLGYDRENNSQRGLVINEAEAQIVKKIFKLYASGKGYRSIANTLNKEGFTTKKGSAFGIPAVKYILNNNLYIGQITYGRYLDWNKSRRRNKNESPIESQGLHEAIIDKELWRKVQRRMKIATRQPRHYSNNSNLLTGIIKCPKCGSAMAISNTTNRLKDGTKKRVRYYSCSQFKSKGSTVCSANSIRADDIEQHIFTFIQEIMASPSLIQSVVQQVNEIRKGKSENDIKVTIDYHRSRYEEIVNKRDRLIDIIANDDTLKDMLAPRIRSFTQEIEEIELAIESLQFEIKQQDEQVDFTVVSTILQAMFSEIGRLTKTELKELYLLTLDSIHFEKCENKKKLYQLNIMVNQSVLDTLFNGQQFDEQLLDCSSFCFSPIILPFEFKA